LGLDIIVKNPKKKPVSVWEIGFCVRFSPQPRRHGENTESIKEKNPTVKAAGFFSQFFF